LSVAVNAQQLGSRHDTPGLFSESGFSLQLNAVPPTNNPNQIQWMQYVLLFGGDSVDAWVEYWSQGPSCCSFATNDVGTACCSNGNCCSGSGCKTKIPLPKPLPLNAFSGIAQISLTTDKNENVTQANFVITDNDGNRTPFSVPIPSSVQAPVQAFQFVAVGYDDCQGAIFYGDPPLSSSPTNPVNSGALITYNAQSGQELCVQGQSNSCGAPSIFTGEYSNAYYGYITVPEGTAMDNCCGSELEQALMLYDI
jgi:hypothetical protein